MSLAYQGAGSDELAAQKRDSEGRRNQILRLYVDQMFRRKGGTAPDFRKVKVIGWLSWLAEKMNENSGSVFLLEELQPSWLGAKAKRVAYGAVVALSFGLTFALVTLTFGLTGLTTALIGGLIIFVCVGLGCWSKSPLQNAVVTGSIFGLIFELIVGLRNRGAAKIPELPPWVIGGLIGSLIGGLGVGSLNHITLVETISWKWNRFWKRTIPGSILGLILGLIVGLIAGLNHWNLWLPLTLYSVVSCGMIGGLVSGLLGGFSDRVKVGKASPNHGIKLSWKNSMVVFLVTWLIVGPILCLIFRANVPTYGLFFGLVVGLNRGGSAVVKHYALRLILWTSGNTPFKFIKFLDYCAKLIFLKKVGGGYIFIHRMLLDYFADLTPPSKRAEDEKAAPVGR